MCLCNVNGLFWWKLLREQRSQVSFANRNRSDRLWYFKPFREEACGGRLQPHALCWQPTSFLQTNVLHEIRKGAHDLEPSCLLVSCQAGRKDLLFALLLPFCNSGLGQPCLRSHRVLEVILGGLWGLALGGVKRGPGPLVTELVLHPNGGLSLKKSERASGWEREGFPSTRDMLCPQRKRVFFALLGPTLSLPSSCFLTLTSTDF